MIPVVFTSRPRPKDLLFVYFGSLIMEDFFHIGQIKEMGWFPFAVQI